MNQNTHYSNTPHQAERWQAKLLLWTSKRHIWAVDADNKEILKLIVHGYNDGEWMKLTQDRIKEWVFVKMVKKPSHFVTAGNSVSSWMTSVQEKSVPFGFTTHHTISYSIQLRIMDLWNVNHVNVIVIQTTKKSCLRL